MNAVPARSVGGLIPETLVDLGDVQVVLDRRKKELRWELAPYRASHWDVPLSLQMARWLFRAGTTREPGQLVRIERSAGHATIVQVSPAHLIQVQTVGRFTGPLYEFLPSEALRVADAILYGATVLSGWS